MADVHAPGADGGESRLHYIQEVLKSAVEEAKNKVRLSGDDTVVRIVQTIQHCRDNMDDLALARQLQHLYSVYFTNRKATQQFHPDQIIELLAHKVNYVHRCNGLWPEDSWVSHHRPNPAWLTEEEITNVTGMNATTYKRTLRELGYAPITAPSKDALDQTWDALYNPGSTGILGLQTSDAERYAVVSYVQCAGGKKPSATWTSEVDSVLTALASIGIITDKAVWFDKLASRQYSDSQKWWGAAATMQFLFNPVIVLLPRMSEQQAFVPVVGQTIWGSNEADKIFGNFVEHAKHCTECCTSFPLQWAVQQDCVLPIAALRTWPRVEHALGASGLGLFSSETTYVALTAILTCAFAMFSALLKNDRDLYDVLCAAESLPSSLIREDDSVLIGWVHVSCLDWQHHSSPDDIMPLKEMASCMMELYHLFCKLQTPKQLALQRTRVDRDQFRSQFKKQKQELRLLSCGLFYTETQLSDEDVWDEDVYVPSLARCNSNDTFDVHGHYPLTMSLGAFATMQAYWALANMRRNLEITLRGGEQCISNEQFVVARHEALTTLVHSRAAQAPCYAWDDKLVAAILLSSPKVFLDAFDCWENHKQGGHMLADLNRALSLAGVLSEIEDVQWEPNSLIVALAMQSNQTVHRLVPRPPFATQFNPVHVAPLQVTAADKGTQKCFAGYFLGHLPLKTVEALRFRTTSGMDLPQVNDWVYRKLQSASLCDSNMIVVRQPWTGSPEQRADQCWHCQKLLAAGYDTPGSSQRPAVSLLPLACLPDDPYLAGVTWGLGSFDPLNLAAIMDPKFYFGLGPDSVAVLLHHSSGTDGNMYLHAHGLAHFAILGSEAVHTCSSCSAIIIEERERNRPIDAEGELLAIWTMLPMEYKHHAQLFKGVGVIRGSI